ncbi:hypothetical protein V1264_018218 [Littorina saxatilis]
MEFVLPAEKQQVVKLTGGRGNNLHAVVDAKGDEFLVSMPTKFRKNIWVKRGDYVIIDPIEEGDKVRGEIAHVLFQEHIKHIQEEGLWPEAFGIEKRKTTDYIEADLLPPSDSEDEDDLGSKVVNANRGCQLYEQSSEDESDEEDDEEEEEEKGDRNTQEETEDCEERKKDDCAHIQR